MSVTIPISVFLEHSDLVAANELFRVCKASRLFMLQWDNLERLVERFKLTSGNDIEFQFLYQPLCVTEMYRHVIPDRLWKKLRDDVAPQMQAWVDDIDPRHLPFQMPFFITGGFAVQKVFDKLWDSDVDVWIQRHREEGDDDRHGDYRSQRYRHGWPTKQQTRAF